MQDWMNDVPGTVRAVQQQLRASTPDLAGRYARLSEALADEVSAIRTESASGGAVPELAFSAVAGGQVTPAEVARIRRRGCVVVRNVFDRARVVDWNERIVRYIDEVRYLERMHEKAGLDRYFSDLASGRPQIFSLYWSQPQMEARSDPAMATVRAWLNRLWTWQRNGQTYFDPDRQFNYSDRIRRREPGDATLGLSPHSDGGSVERWCEPTFQTLYREVFEGDPLKFDPFDAGHRMNTREIPSPAVCSAFRTFQGWTALTTQGPGDGTLQLVPIAKTTPWMLLRALQPDVPEGDLCGAAPGRALGASARWHADLLAGLVSIPRMEPGDTIWWHSDVIHAVEDQHQGKGYSNVIYIGAAPWCERNARFAARQAEHFRDGRSNPDFAPEDYELNFAARTQEAALTPLGARQMGLQPWD